MEKIPLTFETRKALSVHLGDDAGRELADLLVEIAKRIQSLERNKVDVTPIVSMFDDVRQISVASKHKAR